MPPSRPPLAVVGVAALAAVAVLAAALAGPSRVTGRSGGFDLPVPTLPPPTTRPRQLDELEVGVVREAGPPVWVFAAGGVLLVALVVLLVVLVLRLLRRLQAEQAPTADVVPGALGDADAAAVTRALHDATVEAGRRLAEDLPPNDAVVAAWVALERAAEGSGITRDPTETATELTVAVLDGTPADPAATRALLRLYLTARFSVHPVTVDDVRAARASLATIERALAGSGVAS